VGVCQIDLAHKIPWCEDTYIPPATDIFFQPEAAGVIEGVPGNDPGDKVGYCSGSAVWLLLCGRCALRTLVLAMGTGRFIAIR
jgi:hypothetical protein